MYSVNLMAYREEKCDGTKIHICEIVVFFFFLSSHTCANQLRHTKAIRGQVEFMAFNKKGKWRRRKNIFRKNKMKNPRVKNQSVSANWWRDKSIALLWWLHSNPSKFGLDRNVNDLRQFQKVFLARSARGGEKKKIKLYFFPPPSSRDSRKMPRSIRLGHKAPVMQANQHRRLHILGEGLRI